MPDTLTVEREDIDSRPARRRRNTETEPAAEQPSNEQLLKAFNELGERFSALSERMAKVESKPVASLPRGKVEEVIADALTGTSASSVIPNRLNQHLNSAAVSYIRSNEFITFIRPIIAELCQARITEMVNAAIGGSAIHVRNIRGMEDHVRDYVQYFMEKTKLVLR